MRLEDLVGADPVSEDVAAKALIRLAVATVLHAAALVNGSSRTTRLSESVYEADALIDAVLNTKEQP